MKLTKKQLNLLRMVLDEQIIKTKENCDVIISHKDSSLEDYEVMIDMLKDLRYIRETFEGDINV